MTPTEYRGDSMSKVTVQEVSLLDEMQALTNSEYEVAQTLDKEKERLLLANEALKALNAEYCERLKSIETTMVEYASEDCDWNDTEYLIKCAERYGQVAEPTHLHCLAVALANKLKSLELVFAGSKT